MSGSSTRVSSKAARWRFLEVGAGPPHTHRMTQPVSLTNQLLVAMPALADPHFAQTVTLICEHNEQGAFGIVINRPLTLLWGEVLAQMDLPAGDPVLAARPVLCGGPVYPDRGFVVHRSGGHWASTHQVSTQIQVTTSRDVLVAIAQGQGPPDAFMALGHAGWEAGQLERELLDNAWLTLPLNEQLLFDLPVAQRWDAAWQLLGIAAEQVSLTPGHA